MENYEWSRNPNVKRIAVIGFDENDFDNWINDNNLIGNELSSKKRVKIGDEIWLRFVHYQDICAHKGFDLDEIIETKNASKNPVYLELLNTATWALRKL